MDEKFVIEHMRELFKEHREESQRRHDNLREELKERDSKQFKERKILERRIEKLELAWNKAMGAGFIIIALVNYAVKKL